MLQLESSWHGRSVDHVLTYSRSEIAVGSQKPSRITRQNTCCQNEKSLSDFRNLRELRCKTLVAQVCETRRFAFYLRTGVVLMLPLESSWNERSVDHVLPYSEQQIAAGSQKPSGITRQKTCCPNLRDLHELRCKRLIAQVSKTREFALYLRTGVVLMLQLDSPWYRRSVDHVLTYSGKEIAVESLKPS
ncbi:uncharacterized protein G2W53_044995 [Senna tora]|uniref:Uncharacterized protein n=1 Tax=Senna tora TaxID=362788 RepID=A0A834SE17_9FABA|nr:uncharacterized protein G2W53_044995 [Senna tora]